MKRSGRSRDRVPFRSMKVDRAYQREISPSKVKAIKAEFDERGLGVLHVSGRDDGYYLIDGQHRWHAAMELGHGDMKADCVVFRNMTLEDEAALFLVLNDSKNTTPLDRYKASLVAKDDVALGIRKTLAHYGLRISGSGSDGCVRCVTVIEKLYRDDPDKLDSLCLVLTDAWGTRVSAFDASVVTGLGKVLRRYNGELDEGALITKLSKYRGGPTALVGDARGFADIRPISVSGAAAEIIRDTYNRGLRSKALPAL